MYPVEYFDVADVVIVVVCFELSVISTHMLGIMGSFKGAESSYSNRMHEGAVADSSNTTGFDLS